MEHLSSGATNTPTRTPARTPTGTNAPTRTPTGTNAPTRTPTGTTFTPTRTPTRTPTGTNAPTRTPTGTNAPTRTPTGTNAPTRTPTGTNAPTRTPSGAPAVSLVKTYMPPSSTNISASNVTVTFNKNSQTAYTCISGNLGSTNCTTTSAATAGAAPNMPNSAASKCLAICPNNPDVNKVVAYKSGTTGWSWSGNTSSITGITNATNMIKTPVVFNTPSNASSCYIINAESQNCPTVNNFGCQAYCMASPSASGFIVEQRCPDNATSCDPMTLKWIKK